LAATGGTLYHLIAVRDFEFQTKIEFAQVLKEPLPQISITIQTMIPGSNALQISAWSAGVLSWGFGAVMVRPIVVAAQRQVTARVPWVARP